MSAPTKTDRDRRWLILAALCCAMLMVVIDNTVLNVAVPTLMRNLNASAAEVQWSINAYLLVLSGLLLAGGGLSDRYGRKKGLILGLVVFGFGSLSAALSATAAQLILSRALMGVGAALLMPGTLAVLVRIFDENDRPKAIGIWMAVSSFGIAGGPVLGGLLVHQFWWGSIFLVNVPIAALSAVALSFLLTESRDPAGKWPDVLGALLSLCGIVALVWGIISAPVAGWASPRTSGALAVGVAVMVLFVWWQRRARHPMLDLGLFRNPTFTAAVLGGLLTAFGMSGSLYLVTQRFQLLLGAGPLEAGAHMIPLAASMLIGSSVLSARVGKALGAWRALAVSMTVAAAGLLWISLASPYAYTGTMGGLVLVGLGAGTAGPVAGNALMGSIPPEQAGVGSGVNSTIQEFGNGLGVAVLGAVLSGAFVARVPASVADAARDSYPTAVRSSGGSPQVVAQLRDAFANGLAASQLYGAGALLLGAIVSALLLRHAARKQAATRQPAEQPESV